jgi:hypothetical protein
MKSAILLLLSALLLTACSDFQYAVIDSNVKKSAGRIVFENDSVQITYKFSGNNGPAVIGLYNKLSVPLYVNWQRSSLIIQGESVSRVPESAGFSATATTYNWTRWNNTTTTDISGNIQQPVQTGFIPPNSYIQSQPVYLLNEFSVPTEDMKSRRMTGYASVVKYKIFDSEDSPLVFRSYITVSASPDFSNPIAYDHKFWVSEVVRTAISPPSMKPYLGREDVYHVTKASENGPVVVLLAAIALTALFWSATQ